MVRTFRQLLPVVFPLSRGATWSNGLPTASRAATPSQAITLRATLDTAGSPSGKAQWGKGEKMEGLTGPSYSSSCWAPPAAFIPGE
ncbi:exported hypothetical protein [Frankia sp. Hr75.2]|nr:exported hypothetical protein [Frankia sp. Hr75.2]